MTTRMDLAAMVLGTEAGVKINAVVIAGVNK